MFGELLVIFKDNNEGMRCLFILFFFKEKKKCICGAFELDAAVPEKLLYIFFLALSILMFNLIAKSNYLLVFNIVVLQPLRWLLG